METNEKLKETIRASDLIGCKFCVSSEDGQVLFEKIKKALTNRKKVNVSFENLSEISSAFLDAAIGQLYKGLFSDKELKEGLAFTGLSKDELFLLERVILRAKYYCDDPKTLDRAACELVGENHD